MLRGPRSRPEPALGLNFWGADSPEKPAKFESEPTRLPDPRHQEY
jgi:hypothetical protein